MGNLTAGVDAEDIVPDISTVKVIPEGFRQLESADKLASVLTAPRPFVREIARHRLTIRELHPPNRTAGEESGGDTIRSA